MPEDEVPEFAREAFEFQAFQQRQYEKAQREKEQNFQADLSAFATFIEELTNDQLNYVIKLLEEIGSTVYSNQLIGIGIASRVYRRGLMVDGKTYEEALGLVKEPEDDKAGMTDDEDNPHLAFRPSEDADNVPHTCTGCGRKYANKADYQETRAKFDGCPGCQHKEKWG
ncbi:hypothetical protein TIN4_54 [Tsukamurella phage TIN4]|uniref:Uncharacterized protein n=2 Tax=Tinduovirus TIN3 TaxID=1982571 RepID=A0A0K0N5H3_9CAUD|nr:hypothetical protein AVT54_gp071 [Tsukamurella phage TIN3]YP_009604184.1 hypothetical protein FDH87_gp071 [Tsukamurella phage TIN4]AKJ71851.1 hypothetical protein TIN3_54 [Tsukamurella phage TIN3]AKJ71960.1 hypothetical protein TIN4_54 [Tsukamurella phage TIN4]